MKDFCDGNSVNSSPIPQYNFTSKEIQQEITRRQKRQIQSEVIKEIGELADTHPNARRYSHRLLILCLRVFFVSVSAYEIMTIFYLYHLLELYLKDQKIFFKIFKFHSLT